MSIERLGADAAAVCLDDRLRHRKAHSRTARLRVAAGVRTIKAIEQALQITLRHRIYRVTHLQGHPAAQSSLKRKLNLAVLARIARGIILAFRCCRLLALIIAQRAKTLAKP